MWTTQNVSRATGLIKLTNICFQRGSSNSSRNQSSSTGEGISKEKYSDSVSASSEDESIDAKTDQTSRHKTGDNAQGESNNSTCACQRLTIHVLDISKVYYQKKCFCSSINRIISIHI